MAKYDTYTLSVQVGARDDQATLSLTVLFEAEDNEAAVIAAVRDVLETEAIAMKDNKFLNRVKQ